MNETYTTFDIFPKLERATHLILADAGNQLMSFVDRRSLTQALVASAYAAVPMQGSVSDKLRFSHFADALQTGLVTLVERNGDFAASLRTHQSSQKNELYQMQASLGEAFAALRRGPGLPGDQRTHRLMAQLDRAGGELAKRVIFQPTHPAERAKTADALAQVSTARIDVARRIPEVHNDSRFVTGQIVDAFPAVTQRLMEAGATFYRNPRFSPGVYDHAMTLANVVRAQTQLATYVDSRPGFGPAPRND